MNRKPAPALNYKPRTLLEPQITIQTTIQMPNYVPELKKISNAMTTTLESSCFSVANECSIQGRVCLIALVWLTKQGTNKRATESPNGSTTTNKSVAEIIKKCGNVHVNALWINLYQYVLYIVFSEYCVVPTQHDVLYVVILCLVCINYPAWCDICSHFVCMHICDFYLWNLEFEQYWHSLLW